MAKMPAAEIVRVALIWADESMTEMINGLDKSDPHRAEVIDERRQLRAYCKRRFKSTDLEKMRAFSESAGLAR